MVPLVQPDHDGPYLDYEPRPYGNHSQSLICEGYQMEPLVLGDSVIGLNPDDIGYGDMLHTSFKQEVVGMEPSYLADWNGSKWYEETTQQTTQDSYRTLSRENYELAGDYVHYNPHTSYRTLEHPAGTSVQNMGYGSNQMSSYDSHMYHMGACDTGVSRITSVEGSIHSMNSGLEALKHLSSLESGRKPMCSSFESSTMQCSSIEGTLQDLSNFEVHERLTMRPMSEYMPINETTLMGHMGNIRPMQTASLASPQGEVRHDISRVSMDDLTTFNTHFEDLCKPMKRRMYMPPRMNKDIYDTPKQLTVPHFMGATENSNTVNSTPNPTSVGFYDRCLKSGMGSQSASYGPCDPRYMCDPGYADSHQNTTSTPTMRSRLMHNGHKGFGSVAADLTTYQSDAYNTGDMDTMKTTSLDSNMIYNGCHSHMDGFASGRMEPTMIDRYRANMIENAGPPPSVPSTCLPMHDTGKTNAQAEPYTDHMKTKQPVAESPAEDYAHGLMDEVASYQSSSVGKTSQEDYYRVGVDGLDHFSGIVETFKDDEDASQEIDAATMRQLFDGNRYIEDLGNQYDLVRDDSPPTETYVYLRTNTPGEFGGVGLQKEKVVAAPTATSSELCDVLLACSSGAANYEPTITWDQGEQAYVVGWWASDEKGSITKRQSRVFSVAEYGKTGAYEEATRFTKYAETQIRPGDLIRWYPGFNIPIGTSGRTNLRKVLHMDRMKNAELCDPVLAANGMKIATKSTFGDMTIVELYKAAYVLGLWDVAAYNCLKTCKRRFYSYQWIHQMQLMNRRITLDALKYLRNVKESLSANKRPKRNARAAGKRTLR